MEVGF